VARSSQSPPTSGLSLDTANEILFPELPAPPVPTQETVYAQLYWSGNEGGSWFDILNTDESPQRSFALCAIHRFGPNISSALVRSAILYFSSHHNGTTPESVRRRYFCDYCESASAAIDKGFYIEYLYGCYLMCLAEMSHQKTHVPGDHAPGFLSSYRQLTGSVVEGVLTSEEREVFGRAYEVILDLTLAMDRGQRDELERIGVAEYS